jgi:antitoxin component YwqK of YwqJK toxin-antitoxin module
MGLFCSSNQTDEQFWNNRSQLSKIILSRDVKLEEELNYYYGASTILTQKIYFNGKLRKRKIWDENGELFLRQCYFHKDLEKKYYKEWNNEGKRQLRTCFFKNGKLEGENKMWYKNGRLWVHEFYQDNIRNGGRKVWYENNQLAIQQFFRDGELEGEIRTWKNDGTIEEWKFCMKGNIRDWQFHAKRAVFIKLKCLYYRVRFFNLDQFLIPDLSKLI